jgi:hypothetical protein
MSNLDYPISILVAEGGKITTTPTSPGKAHVKQMNKLIGINRAIRILGEYKHADEREKEDKTNSLCKKIKL